MPRGRDAQSPFSPDLVILRATLSSPKPSYSLRTQLCFLHSWNSKPSTESGPLRALGKISVCRMNERIPDAHFGFLVPDPCQGGALRREPECSLCCQANLGLTVSFWPNTIASLCCFFSSYKMGKQQPLLQSVVMRIQ